MHQPIAGGGTTSSHWINGGGAAVDFYSLGGQPLSGADGQSVRLIGLLDTAMPTGARVGQSDCRAASHVTLDTTHFMQFPDACNHLHVGVAYTRGILALGAPSGWDRRRA
jgi:hypothetical protein